ncbi:MAG: alpha/beta fold hydrolase [Flavobacteriales bacterium]|nr:alpha/beta fold hydrolase [Flavobacteriales bacterium]
MTTVKPTILLIHGFPQDHTLWDPQLAALSEVAHVLAPDLRGFGNSDPPKDVMPMQTFARDLCALLDERGIDRAVVCGLSMGGYVALTFLSLWPERVQALVLCNTKATADTPEAREARHETARNAKQKGVAVIARGMIGKVLSLHTRTEKPELVAQVGSMMARQSPEAVAAASLGMAERPDRMVMLPSIDVPTLVITGEADELMPITTSKVMAEAIPGAKLVVLPNAGHLSNLEAPELFNTTVRDFLASLPRA